MPDSENERAEQTSAVVDRSTPIAYLPPRLTRVGNVRALLAGDGGSVADLDPTAEDLRSTPTSPM
jgi:hypothetical protein